MRRLIGFGRQERLDRQRTLVALSHAAASPSVRRCRQSCRHPRQDSVQRIYPTAAPRAANHPSRGASTRGPLPQRDACSRLRFKFPIKAVFLVPRL
jgi:hypothetical protein